MQLENSCDICKCIWVTVETFFADSHGIPMRLLQRFYRFEVGVVIFAGIGVKK